MNTIRREQKAGIYMGSLSAAGWILVLICMFFLTPPEHYLLYFMLVIFLGFTEYFPLPVWKGSSSLSFPIIFSLDLVFGFPAVIFSYALVVMTVNLLHRRPLRIILFNPAQLVISYAAAKGAAELFFSGGFFADHLVPMSELAVLIVLFYLINNFLVDIVLWIRPQPYRFSVWMQKWASEFFSAFISFFYISLMFFLGSQENRGNLDVFAAFFFFSPLVGLSLLSSTIARLKIEKNRLNAMFSFTKDLNQTVHTAEWKDGLTNHIQELFHAQAVFLIRKEGIWKFDFKDGMTADTDRPPEPAHVEEIKDVLVIENRKKMSGPLDYYFHKGIRSVVYSPLMLEDECIGVLAVGRTRTYSFEPQDIRSIATLANQLAVALKTKSLITEQKEKRVLEERNRIAREIHDGVAQTLAGAVMNLETAKKKFSEKPDETLLLMDRSLHGLRGGLKQVRESIYALRPKPTERVTLQEAIQKRVEIIRNQQSFRLDFEVRGNLFPMPLYVEKVMFDTFQESIQNTVKHGQATKAEVLLSYQSEHVLLKIKDNGKGFSLYDAILKSKNEPHFGLISMNEEAEEIEGSLQIDSKPGEGTEISLTVPIEKMRGDEEND